VAADTEVLTLDSAEWGRRVNLARSILGHAPDITPVRRALMALEGASDREICAAQGTKAVARDDQELSCWYDGWDQGREQRCVQCQATGSDRPAA
jgi:hypothetical protein